MTVTPSGRLQNTPPPYFPAITPWRWDCAGCRKTAPSKGFGAVSLTEMENSQVLKERACHPDIWQVDSFLWFYCIVYFVSGESYLLALYSLPTELNVRRTKTAFGQIEECHISLWKFIMKCITIQIMILFESKQLFNLMDRYYSWTTTEHHILYSTNMPAWKRIFGSTRNFLYESCTHLQQELVNDGKFSETLLSMSLLASLV